MKISCYRCYSVAARYKKSRTANLDVLRPAETNRAKHLHALPDVSLRLGSLSKIASPLKAYTSDVAVDLYKAFFAAEVYRRRVFKVRLIRRGRFLKKTQVKRVLSRTRAQLKLPKDCDIFSQLVYSPSHRIW